MKWYKTLLNIKNKYLFWCAQRSLHSVNHFFGSPGKSHCICFHEIPKTGLHFPVSNLSWGHLSCSKNTGLQIFQLLSFHSNTLLWIRKLNMLYASCTAQYFEGQDRRCRGSVATPHGCILNPKYLQQVSHQWACQQSQGTPACQHSDPNAMAELFISETIGSWNQQCLGSSWHWSHRGSQFNNTLKTALLSLQLFIYCHLSSSVPWIHTVLLCSHLPGKCTISRGIVQTLGCPVPKCYIRVLLKNVN